MPSNQSEDAVLGREAANIIWQQGLRSSVETVLTREFADAAISEFRRLQLKHSTGIIGDFLEGAEMAAEQLNVEDYHGVLEVAQNADDLQAKTLRVALRRKGRARQLLLCHDGDPVQLQHAIAMTVAFLSTKRDDPRLKGKFGIGLKTLQRLGRRLSVHCAPFHFQIENGRVDLAEPEEEIRGFYDPKKRHTLVVVALSPKFDYAKFKDWLAKLGATSMIFLEDLSRIDLLELPSAKIELSLQLRREAANPVQLAVGSRRLECSICRARDARRRSVWWTTYKVELPVDKTAALARSYKATAKTTTLSITVPDSRRTGMLYVGLPTGVHLGVPFSLNGEFDPDTSRESLLHNAWNEWLFQSLADLALAVAVLRFKSEPATGWGAVGLDSEANAWTTDRRDDDWLSERLSTLISVQHDGLRRMLRLPGRGKKVGLAALCYEVEALEGLVTENDLAALCEDKHPLGASFRDAEGRWRGLLTDLGDSTALEVEDAVEMLGWDDDDLGNRSGEWFVALAVAAVDAECEYELFDTWSLLLNDGSRVRPFHRDVGCLVTIQALQTGLGARLGVIGVLDPAYASGSGAAQRLREFLVDEGALIDRPEPVHVLTALSTWDEDVTLADSDLLELRDLIDSVDADTAKSLAAKIGRVVVVDGRFFENGGLRKTTLHPSEAYLSPALEKARSNESWGRAAGKTPGLEWIHPRYADVVTSGRDREQTGATSLFGLLGAARSPRLVRPPVATTMYKESVFGIDRSDGNALQLAQIDALNKQERTWWATHLRNDWISPDLTAVAADIASMRPSKARSERARNLIAVLDRSWRHYENRTEAFAVYGRYQWVPMGPVPATWLSQLAGIPWLTNTSRSPRPLEPHRARVRTELNAAIHGKEDEHWVREITARDASLPIVSALGIEGDPRARTVLDRLIDWRDHTAANPSDANWTAVRRLYSALAAHCRKTANGKWALVDNVAPAELRRTFTTSQLVLSNGAWYAPKDVFRGAAMFGGDKASVPSDEALNPLWGLLNIEVPSADDCVKWLRKLMKRLPTGPSEDQSEIAAQIVEVYRHLFGLAPTMQTKERRYLHTLPLTCGARWVTDRPVYACHDADVAMKLASQDAPVWTPPCSLDGLRAPFDDLQVELVQESEFSMSGVNAGDHVRAEPLQSRFSATVDRLRMNLADKDAAMYRAFSLGDWRQLQTADLAVAPDLGLSVSLAHKTYRLPGHAHLSLDPLMLVVRDEDDLARSDRGGRLIASLFDVSEKDRWTIALAWEAAWRAAGEGRDARGLTLIDETPHWAAGSEDEQTQALPVGREKKAQRPKTPTPEQSERRKQKVLKNPELLTPEVEEPGAAQYTPGAVTTKKKRSLVKDRPHHDRKKRRAGQRGPGKDYAGDQREDVGYDLLEAIVRDNFARTLIDCRDEPARGADAVDDLDRSYYELKVHGGPAPDHVSLTRSEAERALQKRKDYFLVVVSGVDEGQTTRLTMIPDPLHNLDWHPKDDVQVGGYQTKRFATWLFRDEADRHDTDGEAG